MLFNWTWHMGMLRGVDEHELAALEYQGNGTIQVDGQPCTLTKYRSSTNYQTPGSAFSTRARGANGQTFSNVEVVSGQYAWNEDTPGAEIVRAKARPRRCRGGAGTADPLVGEPAGRGEGGARRARVDLTQGATRATCCRTASRRSASTTVAWEGEQAGCDVPDSGVPGATATATLDAKHMAERVVVKQGSTTTEFTYSDYDDWNNPLNKIEAFYAGKMAERRNGTVVRDLTTTETETGSVYVVMPVPASVQKAIAVAVPAPPRPMRSREPSVRHVDQPTPRMADGKPDLTGNWACAAGMNWRYGFRRCGPTQLEGCTPTWQSDARLRVRSALAVRAESSRCTSPSTGTRSSSSTCGRTRKIRS